MKSDKKFTGFSADKPVDKTVKIHYLNPLTKKSLCRRSSTTWLDMDDISGGANISENIEEVTCKFCLRYYANMKKRERIFAELENEVRIERNEL